MFKVFFLVLLFFLGHLQFLQPQCLFCECRYDYDVQRKKPFFSGTKKVKRWYHVRDIGDELPSNYCSLCLSGDHRVISIKKCGAQCTKETVAHLCSRCLKNAFIPASSYELMVNDSMSAFVCAKCEHEVDMHI